MKAELLNQLREQWTKLAPGERRLAIAGSIVVGITLLYVLLWLPVQKELTRLRVSRRAAQPAASRRCEWNAARRCRWPCGSS